jgi:hypothetical protein
MFSKSPSPALGEGWGEGGLSFVSQSATELTIPIFHKLLKCILNINLPIHTTIPPKQKTVLGITKMTIILRSISRHLFSYINPLIYETIAINEFPKSGGTWVCQVLSHYLDYRFDDNKFPGFGNSIMKFHKMNIAPQLKEVAIMRDPRAVMISFYYHSFFVYEDNPFNKKMVSLAMDKFRFKDYRDIENNISIFIDHMLKKTFKPDFLWSEFYRNKIDHGVEIFRYEDLRKSPNVYFEKVLSSLGYVVDRDRLSKSISIYDIEKLKAGRTASQKVNFVRSGNIEEWKKILTNEDNLKILENYGPLMHRFGYI